MDLSHCETLPGHVESIINQLGSVDDWNTLQSTKWSLKWLKPDTNPSNKCKPPPSCVVPLGRFPEHWGVCPSCSCHSWLCSNPQRRGWQVPSHFLLSSSHQLILQEKKTGGGIIYVTCQEYQTLSILFFKFSSSIVIKWDPFDFKKFKMRSFLSCTLE